MQAGAVQSKLSEVWASLTGQSCAFASSSSLPLLQEDDACFSLPITDGVTGYTNHNRALVLLQMGRADALALAAAMFGLPAAELQPADLQDAGMELCNILSACLLECLGDTSLSHLGLPEAQAHEAWRQLSQSAPALALYVSDDPAQRLAVMMIEISTVAGEAGLNPLPQPDGLSSEH
ncbi:hypothetical protein [Roseateles sp.]|uniref:hypothetical protein n=1 Tax=Roseateles sp. TaxID=1971397 RepID=UPI003BA7D6EC